MYLKGPDAEAEAEVQATFKRLDYLASFIGMCVILAGTLFLADVLSDNYGEAAPAPLPRPPKIKAESYPVGEWSLWWGTSEWHYTFHADGTLFGRHSRPTGNSWYEGHWRLDNHGRLCVDEASWSLKGESETRFRWYLDGVTARYQCSGNPVMFQVRLEKKK